MILKHIRQSLANLSSELVKLNMSVNKQNNAISELVQSQRELFENQKLLSGMIKKLADCFQLEYEDGRYVSKKKRKK